MQILLAICLLGLNLTEPGTSIGQYQSFYSHRLIGDLGTSYL